MKIKIQNIKKFFLKLPKSLAERAFLVSLFFIILSLIFGGVMFFQYNSFLQKTEIKIIEKPLKFNETLYQNILKIWQEREKRFQEVDSKIYSNLFK